MPSIPSFRNKHHAFTRLIITKNARGQPKRIGGNTIGDVYLARWLFPARENMSGKHKNRQNVRVRVAVKVFKKPLSLEGANNYKRKIKKLHELGIGLPKMDLVKIPTHRSPEGEWVLISQLFYAGGKSKLAGKSELKIPAYEGRREAITILVKVANAGLFPALDLVEHFAHPENPKRRGVVPIDPDEIVDETEWSQRGYDKEKFYPSISDELLRAVNLLTNEPNEQRQLFHICISQAKGKVWEALHNNHRSPFS